jgi:amidohydrolase
VTDPLIERLVGPFREHLPEVLGRDYRELHAIPELAFRENQTALYLADRLRHLGLEPRTGLAGTGLIVELPGGGEGPTVVLRADMDALPVVEAPTHDPRSQHEGLMHACGHDGHMAMALGVAETLAGAGARAAPQDRLPGRILLMFQPAEESGGGASLIVDDGWLDEVGADYVLGTHLWSGTPLGEMICPDDAVMASSDEFSIVLKGPGGHGALPHTSRDLVLAASHLIVALHGIVSRDVDPVCPAVLTVGRIESGTAPNIIPVEARLDGTFRTADGATRGLVLHRIGELCQGFAVAHGIEVEVDFGRGYPPTVNHAMAAAALRRAAGRVLGETNVHTGPMCMASEDFAFYLQARAGAFCLLGIRDEAEGVVHAHHTPEFRISEKAMPWGVEILIGGALELMEKAR